MRPDRLPQPVKLGLYGLAVALLLYLTLAPSEALPDPGIGDKSQHGLAWAVLAGLGLALWPRRIAAVAVFALSLGVAIELLQGGLGLGREGDWTDLIADVAGIAAALVLFAGLRARMGS